MYSKLYLAPPFVDATLRNVSSVVSQPTQTVYDPHPLCDFHTVASDAHPPTDFCLIFVPFGAVCKGVSNF